MKKLALALSAFAALTLVVIDSEARRFGGGRNLGMQRSAPAAPQKAAPTQQPQQQAAPATPAQQPQPSAVQRWLGPLAGLALGAGLAALFLNNGLAGVLAGLLVLGLIAAVAVFAARALMRGRVAERPLQYAGVPGSAQPPLAGLPGGAGAQSVTATTGARPQGFDAAEFVRHAKLNFVRLQEAHDRGDFSLIGDFVTPEFYRELEAEAAADGAAPRHTDVVTLQAEVIEVAQEDGSYVVSVRFSGLIREAAGVEAAPFSETWHLVKPDSGRSGWRVAGIQQS